MTIRKGEAWGTTGALGADGVVVRSDAEARHVLEAARRANRPFPPLGLLGGDLCRTLGGRGDEARLRSDDATVVTVDLGEALVDGRVHLFVAHVIGRRRTWWRGRAVAVMNAQYLGPWDVAPRSHPNDGLLDIVEVDARLGIGQRWTARRRLPSGTHVPHPLIEQRRSSATQLDVDGLGVWIDGERIGAARHLSLRVEPDAITCVV